MDNLSKLIFNGGVKRFLLLSVSDSLNVMCDEYGPLRSFVPPKGVTPHKLVEYMNGEYDAYLINVHCYLAG